MKKVFKSASECIHTFAQRSQSEGRSSNVFFDGVKIYSYGYHFLAADFFSGINGEIAIRINPDNYSHTTAKHLSQIWAATRQYKQFDCFSESYLYSELKGLHFEYQRSRLKFRHVISAHGLIMKFDEYCNFSGYKPNFEYCDLYLENHRNLQFYLDFFKSLDLETALAEKANYSDQRERTKTERKILTFTERLAKWYGFKLNGYLGENPETKESYLRINGDHVETTLGVKVPIKEAKILYLLIKNGRDIKGHQIGQYTVISINGTLKIGCHSINMESVNEVGEKLIQMNF